MARNTGLYTGAVTTLRSATALIAAESATLSDANYPVAQAIDCTGFDTLLVGVEVTAGTNPTMTIEALVRDGEASDGARWKRMTSGLAFEGTPTVGDTGELDGTAFVELAVFGAKYVMLRIKAVTNAASTTAWKILGTPGRTRNISAVSR